MRIRMIVIHGLPRLGWMKKMKVFWSGGRLAQQAAQEYAESIGGTILEMTPQGKALEAWTKDMDWVIPEPLWKKTQLILLLLLQNLKHMQLLLLILLDIEGLIVYGRK